MPASLRAAVVWSALCRSIWASVVSIPSFFMASLLVSGSIALWPTHIVRTTASTSHPAFLSSLMSGSYFSCFRLHASSQQVALLSIVNVRSANTILTSVPLYLVGTAGHEVPRAQAGGSP